MKSLMCPPTSQIYFNIFEMYKSSTKENARRLQWAGRFQQIKSAEKEQLKLTELRKLLRENSESQRLVFSSCL